MISQSRDPDAPAFPEALSEVQAFAKEKMLLGAPLEELRSWPPRLYDAL